MPHITGKFRLCWPGIMLSFLIMITSAQASNTFFEFDLPSQPLTQSLEQFQKTTGINIVYAPKELANYYSPAIQGQYTPRQAIQILLAEHRLNAEFISDSMIAVKLASAVQKFPEIIVTGVDDPDSPYSTQYQVPKAFVGTKTDIPIMQTPFSVQVVPRPVLQDQQAVRLDTAVQNVSGVALSGFNQGSSDGFLIRGFQSNTIYRNGVFMPDMLGGGTVKRETANIERVEILKGPGSILFGRADPGGIINTVTKQPLATPYYSLQQQVGSFDFYRTAFDATGPLTRDDTLLYRLNVSYENSGLFRDFVDNKSILVAPVIRWNISPRTQITAEMEYQNFNQQSDPGIPPLGNKPAPIPLDRYVGEPLNGQSKGDRKFFGINWSHQFNENWQVSHRLGAELFDFGSYSLFFGAAEADGTLVRRFNNAPNSKSERYQSSINLTGKIVTGVFKHTLLFGYDYIFMDDKLKGLNCCTAAPEFNIFNPSYMTATPILDPDNNFNVGYTQSWHGVYFQDQVKLPYNIHLLAGFRYDNTTSRDTVLGLTTAAEDRVSPRGGLLWQPLHWLSLYGSYTENFGPSNTIFNTDGRKLPPQTAQQWETGLKTEFFGGRLRSTFSYFDLTKHGIGVPDPNNPMFTRAIGEAKTRGIEFDIAGEILRGWNVIATYSYMPFAKITKDVGSSGLPSDTGNQGNRLFLAAKHTGSLWSTYAFQNEQLRGFKVGGGIIGVGKREGNAGNTYHLPAYVIGNLMASYQMRVGPTLVTAQLNVNNVSNKRYFVGTNSGAFITPGAPRTFLGSLRIEY